MRFLGAQTNLTLLKESQENLVDSLLMNAFNAGYESYNAEISELYKQAEAAINQKVPLDVVENNPFVDLINLYVSVNKTTNEGIS